MEGERQKAMLPERGFYPFLPSSLFPFLPDHAFS